MNARNQRPRLIILREDVRLNGVTFDPMLGDEDSDATDEDSGTLAN